MYIYVVSDKWNDGGLNLRYLNASNENILIYFKMKSKHLQMKLNHQIFEFLTYL